MNFLKKGPELKLSEIKVPDFLFDLYYDLKERHLLPLVALLAIALVVVPIALSRSAGSASEAPQEAAIATPSNAGGEAGTLAVARSTPGLRDYRRRLQRAHALDPFRPQAEAAAAAAGGPAPVGADAAPPAAEAAPPAAEITGSPSASVEAPTRSSPPAGVPSEPEAAAPGAVTKTRTKYASQTLDVRIVTVPKRSDDAAEPTSKPKPQIRRRVPELTMLPSRDTPAVVFMGTSSDARKALLLVSSDVESLSGDGSCVIGSQTCQLLALAAGVPETFVYGPQGRTYRIEVLKIERTLSDEPRRASLGKRKARPDGAGEEAPASAGRVSRAQPR